MDFVSYPNGLAECPFCGSENICIEEQGGFGGWYAHARCRGCQVTVSGTSEKDAIVRWNTRSTKAAEALRYYAESREQFAERMKQKGHPQLTVGSYWVLERYTDNGEKARETLKSILGDQ